MQARMRFCLFWPTIVSAAHIQRVRVQGTMLWGSRMSQLNILNATVCTLWRQLHYVLKVSQKKKPFGRRLMFLFQTDGVSFKFYRIFHSKNVPLHHTTKNRYRGNREEKTADQHKLYWFIMVDRFISCGSNFLQLPSLCLEEQHWAEGVIIIVVSNTGALIFILNKTNIVK